MRSRRAASFVLTDLQCVFLPRLVNRTQMFAEEVQWGHLMTAFTDILANHAPYASKRSDNTVCLRCLDGNSHGEFATTTEWATHVEQELVRAGLRIEKCETPAPVEQLGLI